ncbi:hypothetical protein J5N97_002039 [Dioscorea zingiberensis]|uniref:Uncharacterized protein n=1 Tax=Dioscorea zingiberensis TaxID=325984 RepID=A0A9D5BST6_9LILI|nr:hypothetical protein J5N97_002039 [Dioscorea zingiberensis]
MTIARSDLLSSPCTKRLINTTLNYTRFSYVQTVRNLTLYYGCLPQHESVFNNFTCKIDGTSKDIAYYVDESLSRVDFPNRTSCFTNIRVPIFWEGFDVMPENATKEVENVLNRGFQVEYMAEWDLCKACLNSNGTCVSNATTDSFLCLCRDRPYEDTCPIAHGVCSVAGTILFFIIGFGIKHSISVNKETNNEDVEALIQNIGPLAVKRYKFFRCKENDRLLQKINWVKVVMGMCTKGKLLNSCPVAVKVLKESKGNGEDFVNEVASISRTSHVNVVTLLGYCFEGKKKSLIYEFMPNGSLEKFIYKDSNPLKTTPLFGIGKTLSNCYGIASRA